MGHAIKVAGGRMSESARDDEGAKVGRSRRHPPIIKALALTSLHFAACQSLSYVPRGATASPTSRGLSTTLLRPVACPRDLEKITFQILAQILASWVPRTSRGT